MSLLFLSASCRHVWGHSATLKAGLSPTLNFKNMSQALKMHYLRPWSDVALLSQAYVLHVFQRCWKTSRDFTDRPQSDTHNIHLAAMATALTTMYSWLFPTEIIVEKKSPIMWTAQTEYLPLLFSFWQSSQGNLEGHFSNNIWILNQRSWKW